jgi:predicted nucleic acid-binding protein
LIFVDSNVLIDVLDDDENWFHWSVTQLEIAAEKGRVVINHVVLAEVAPHQEDLATLIDKLADMAIDVEPMTDEGAFMAGKSFLRYRRKRENSGSVIADFLIGGHAEHLDAAILTRDPRFYRTYFPSVPLITPKKDEND